MNLNSRTLTIAAALLSLGFLGRGPAFAQDDEGPGIKVTYVQHPDGTHTETQKDPSTATAETKTFDTQNKLTHRIVYKLDENQQEVEGTLFSSKGKEMYHFTFARNSAGQITEERDISNEGALMRKLVYHYNSNGRVSGIDTYDGNGNLVPAGPAKKKSRSSQSSSQ